MNKIKLKQIEDIQLDDVTMPNVLNITKDVGEISLNGAAYKTISKTVTEVIEGQEVTRDKTAWELFNEMFSARKIPAVVQPTIKVTPVYDSGLSKDIEIGTTVIPKAKITTTAGSYQLAGTTQPSTGVTWSGITVTLAGDSSETKDVTNIGETISFDSCKITKVLSATTQGTHSNSTTNGLDNFGQDAPEAKITSATKNSSIDLFVPYRSWFIGTVNRIVTSTNLPTSDEARALTIKGKPSKTRVEYTNKVSGVGTLIVAVPVSANINLKAIKLPAQSDAEVPFDNIGTVDINGANNYAAASYKVWAYSSEALSNGTRYSFIFN